ncbi:hypothetical protein AAFF_G00121240 [Aldrovandia affinis]|uniref:Reverse transcriptase/retrotransposon-derived protein RNase H-like domain-containing protein n=1 Tax=Aldrovandia affinis TaxID=143900 RepID=A0AAD7RRX8_9TELE|nr:hypothetical protein AAFF_G00121240 [Aldrovandia affinis]
MPLCRNPPHPLSRRRKLTFGRRTESAVSAPITCASTCRDAYPLPRIDEVFDHITIDLLVHASSFKLALANLHNVLTAIRQAGLRLNPLHRLTDKYQPFVWTEECAEAFARLRTALTEAPVLAYPDVHRPFIVDTDANCRHCHRQEEKSQVEPEVTAVHTISEAGWLPVSPEQLREGQEADGTLQKVRGWLEAGRPPQWAEVLAKGPELKAYYELPYRSPTRLHTRRPDVWPGAPDREPARTEACYFHQLLERLQVAHNFSRQAQDIVGLQQKRAYDQHCKGQAFKPGDRVWIHCPVCKKGLFPKLQSYWCGPGEVVGWLSEVTYRVRMPNWGCLVVLHQDQLAPYHPLAAEDVAGGKEGSSPVPSTPPAAEEVTQHTTGRPTRQWRLPSYLRNYESCPSSVDQTSLPSAVYDPGVLPLYPHLTPPMPHAAPDTHQTALPNPDPSLHYPLQAPPPMVAFVLPNYMFPQPNPPIPQSSPRMPSAPQHFYNPNSTFLFPFPQPTSSYGQPPPDRGGTDFPLFQFRCSSPSTCCSWRSRLASGGGVGPGYHPTGHAPYQWGRTGLDSRTRKQHRWREDLRQPTGGQRV